MTRVIDDTGIHYFDNNGILKAEIIFKKTGENEISATHTFVDDSLRGQGIARKLVEEMISYAKEYSYQIVPVCSYVVHYQEKNPNPIFKVKN